MLSTAAHRNLPIFLLLLLCVSPSAHCDSTSTAAQVYGKNGQNGTPNLTIAPSRLVDWTHYGTAAQALSSKIELSRHVAEMLKQLDQDIKSPHPDRKKVSGEITAIERDIDELLQNAYSKSVYMGIEVRGGSGQTDYTAPAVSYTDASLGLELGADYRTEAGAYHAPNSVGVSIKGDITEEDRRLTRLFALSDAELRAWHVNQKQEDKDLHVIEDNLEQNDSPNSPLQPKSDTDVFDTNVLEYENDIKQDYAAIAGKDPFPHFQYLPRDYIRETKKIAVSALAGTRQFSEGSTLSDAGLTASVLTAPFGDGKPGLTLLDAVQDFQYDPAHFARGNAVRNGIALIYQDRTPAENSEFIPALMKFERSPLAFPHIPLPLLPTWRYKIGVEYLTPLLGLTKTYDGFFRYRDPKSYVEITLTYGEDGLGKDYGGVTIGTSLAF